MSMDKQIRDPGDMPLEMTEEQARDFWDTHEVTEEYLSKVGTSSQRYSRRGSGTKPISLRLEEDTIRRLKELARTKNKGYQTLLKEFVSERLNEEELTQKLDSTSGMGRSSMSKFWSNYSVANSASVQHLAGTRLVGTQPLREARLRWALATVGKTHSSPVTTPSELEIQLRLYGVQYLTAKTNHRISDSVINR